MNIECNNQIRVSKSKISVVWLFCTVLCITAAPQSGLVFHGTMYSDLSLYHYNVSENDRIAFGGRNTLSLACENTNRIYGKIEARIDIIQLYGVQADALYEHLPQPLLELVSLNGAPLFIDLQKLYVSVYLPFADISIGRQIVNFGKGFIFSPLDVFSTVDIADLDFGRRGTDAVVIRYPIGSLSGVDFISELPFGENEHASAVKAFTTVLNFDWSALGIYRHKSKEIISGLGCKGDAVVGIYGEAVLHMKESGSDLSFQAMLGADYSFLNGDLVIMAEYFYRAKPDNIVSGWGKHNAFVNMVYTFNEIMNVRGNVIHNFSDTVTIGSLQYFYNIRQNVDLVMYLRGYYGDMQSLLSLPDLEYALRIEVTF